jgi:hypothetical protein
VNRVLPVLLIGAAIGFHFMYCEWEVCDHEPIVSRSHFDRMLFYRYNRAYHRDIFLLSKPGEDREEAQFYGLLLPGVLIGGALLVFKLTAYADSDPGRPQITA